MSMIMPIARPEGQRVIGGSKTVAEELSLSERRVRQLAETGSLPGFIPWRPYRGANWQFFRPIKEKCST